MIGKQSATISRDAKSAVLLRHKCQAEIEKAIDKVKLGVVLARRRTNTDKWFRRQRYRAMMRDRRELMRLGISQSQREATGVVSLV